MMVVRQRRGAHGTYLGLGLGKEVADVLLRLTDVLVQNLGACARGAGERGKGKVRCTERAGEQAHTSAVPFTILGSRERSILPICRAMSVLPVPGGPKRSTPVVSGDDTRRP